MITAGGDGIAAGDLPECCAHGKYGLHRIGYYGAIPNPQFDYDHRNDIALYLDDDFVSRKPKHPRSIRTYKELAGVAMPTRCCGN